MLPVPIKIDHTAIKSEQNMPMKPMIVHIIKPASGVARNCRLANSIRCSSSVSFHFDVIFYSNL